MRDYLKRIIARLRRSARGAPPTSPPQDPNIAVRHPKWRQGPGGSSAVALVEPEEQGPPIAAIGRNRGPEEGSRW